MGYDKRIRSATSRIELVFVTGASNSALLGTKATSSPQGTRSRVKWTRKVKGKTVCVALSYPVPLYFDTDSPNKIQVYAKVDGQPVNLVLKMLCIR